MTATGHAIVGAAIVTKIPDLQISLPLVLLSHILGDLPDHWDTAINWKNRSPKEVFTHSLIDVVASYLLVGLIFIWLLGQDPFVMFLAVFTSQLFDYLEVPYFFLAQKSAPWSWINNFVHLFHKKLPQLNLTLFNQIIISSLFILWSWS